MFFRPKVNQRIASPIQIITFARSNSKISSRYVFLRKNGEPIYFQFIYFFYLSYCLSFLLFFFPIIFLSYCISFLQSPFPYIILSYFFRSRNLSFILFFYFLSFLLSFFPNIFLSFLLSFFLSFYFFLLFLSSSFIVSLFLQGGPT